MLHRLISDTSFKLIRTHVNVWMKWASKEKTGSWACISFIYFNCSSFRKHPCPVVVCSRHSLNWIHIFYSFDKLQRTRTIQLYSKWCRTTVHGRSIEHWKHWTELRCSWHIWLTNCYCRWRSGYCFRKWSG